MSLSVVIPAYNRQLTVSKTIKSVQSCGVSTQILVVDDGSKDCTAEVARECGVTVVRQENGGPAAARNTGIANTTGDILAFLDSDDTWLPNTAAIALQTLQNHPEFDVIFCETLVGNKSNGYRPLSESTGLGHFGEMLTTQIDTDLYEIDRGRFVRMMLERNQVFLGSMLVRRFTLDRFGNFDPRLFGGEDYELCLRLAAGARWAFLTLPLARYEKHADGLSADPDRMSREFALAMRNMLARRDLFTSAEYSIVRHRHRELSFNYAYHAYDRGDLPSARLRFYQSICYGDCLPRTLALAASCYLPYWLNRRLRKIKQSVSP